MNKTIFRLTGFLIAYSVIFPSTLFSGETVRADPMQTPLVLVHGFLGFSGYTDTCIIGSTLPYHYSGDSNPNKDTDYSSVQDGVEGKNRAYFGEAPQRFEAIGYDVWIAHVASGPTNLFAPWQVVTPPLAQNGACLAGQLASIQATNPLSITLVAHSMGGAVSRACLTIDNQSPNCHTVNRLVTLGSPHAGLPGIYGWGIDVWAHPGILELVGDRVITFNQNNPLRTPTDVTFLVGQTQWLPFGGGDLVIGKYSGLGWTNQQASTAPAGWDTNYCDPSLQACNRPKHYWTDEIHTNYFKDRDTSTASDSLRCLQWLWQGSNGAPPGSCSEAQPNLQNLQTHLQTGELQATTYLTGTIDTGMQITRKMQVDGEGLSTFQIFSTGALVATLVRPDGQVIDQARARENPAKVFYAALSDSPGTPHLITYVVRDSLPGEWQIVLSNPAGGRLDYQALAQFASARTLNVSFSAQDLAIGSTAWLTATLANGLSGIQQASVKAILARSDGVNDTLTLLHQGNGIYRASYQVPAVPGYLLTQVSASGTDNGTPFTRQSTSVLAIAPPTMQLLGEYAEQAPDQNMDNAYESLDLHVSIHSDTQGPLLLAAELWANGQSIASTQIYTNAIPGQQILPLRFAASDIYHARQNGPYTLAHVVLYDLNYGSIAASTAQDAYTTAAYNYHQFGTTDDLNIFMPLLIQP